MFGVQNDCKHLTRARVRARALELDCVEGARASRVIHYETGSAIADFSLVLTIYANNYHKRCW